MGVITVRNIPEEVHNNLRVRAKRNKRSTEAEVRAILEDAVRPAKDSSGAGAVFAALRKKIRLSEEECEIINGVRTAERVLIEPIGFEK